ncbi:MAG: hypothetical protein PHE55_05105 [Methylococcaceae bacterium]|jgi:hypothetical protein|nr:hypothetical protein [Methylococcaceae bacterium]
MHTREIARAEFQETARELYNKRQCPGCGRKMSLWEVLAMLNGSGVREYLQVRHTDGAKEFLPIEEINPQMMDVIEE